MRYFIEKECPDDGIFTLDAFKMMIGDDIEEIELLEMERDYGGEMWCEGKEDFVKKGDCDCGCFCQQYSPCNGKSGRCRSLKNGFIETGREFILTKNGLREIRLGE